MREDGAEGEGTVRGRRGGIYLPAGHRGEEVPTQWEKEKPGRGCPLSTRGQGGGLGWPCGGLPWWDGTRRGVETSPHGVWQGKARGGRPRTPLTVQGQSGWRDGVRECVGVYGGGNRCSPLPLLWGKTQKHLPQPGWAGGS